MALIKPQNASGHEIDRSHINIHLSIFLTPISCNEKDRYMYNFFLVSYYLVVFISDDESLKILKRERYIFARILAYRVFDKITNPQRRTYVYEK